MYAFFFKKKKQTVSVHFSCILINPTLHLCKSTWWIITMAEWLSTFPVTDVLRNLQLVFRWIVLKHPRSFCHSRFHAHRLLQTTELWHDGAAKMQTGSEARLCSCTIKGSQQADDTELLCSRAHTAGVLALYDLQHYFNEMVVKLHPH